MLQKKRTLADLQNKAEFIARHIGLWRIAGGAGLGAPVRPCAALD